MEELDRVTASPALAAALEHSSSLTVDQKKSAPRTFTAPENLIDETRARPKPQLRLNPTL